MIYGEPLFPESQTILLFKEIKQMRFSPLVDLPLRMGSGCRTAQQHAAGGCVRPLHGASVQSSVPGLRAARVHLQRLLNMDRVQVEEHQWTHLPGGQSRPGGEFISACRQSPLGWHTHLHTHTHAYGSVTDVEETKSKSHFYCTLVQGAITTL